MTAFPQNGLRLAAILGALAAPAAAEDLPAELAAKAETARLACAAIDGVFDPGWGAVRRVDLDGDLDMDWVLNEVSFNCSTAASLYCGTGGCMSHFLVDGTVMSMMNRGWDAVTIGPMRVVIADVHGTLCDGIGPTPCATASMWDAEAVTWRSAGAIWE